MAGHKFGIFEKVHIIADHPILNGLTGTVLNVSSHPDRAYEYEVIIPEEAPVFLFEDELEAGFPGVDGHPASVEEFVRTIAPFAPQHDGSYMALGELVTKYELTLAGGARVFIEVRS